jgi:hypothetical protein
MYKVFGVVLAGKFYLLSDVDALRQRDALEGYSLIS